MKVSSILKIVAVLEIAILAGLSAQAAPRAVNFNVKKAQAKNLLSESSALQLSSETSVQKENPPPDMFVSVLGGIFQPSYLTLSSHGNSVTYGFERAVPLLSAQFNKNSKTLGTLGRWGFVFSAGYSYSENRSIANPTALHLIPVQGLFSVRFEKDVNQKYVPYILAGPSFWAAFQRGTDDYNTSISFWSGSLAAGVAVNLNRLGWFHARNDAEFLLQYQRTIAPSTEDRNWNGGMLQAGGTLAF